MHVKDASVENIRQGWIHRATWDDGAKTDRIILKAGKRAGRVYFLPHGPQRGNWKWCGNWIGPNNSGVVESIEDALQAIKTAYARIEMEEPGRLMDP